MSISYQDPFSRFFVTESKFDLREIKFYTRLLPDLHNVMSQHPGCSSLLPTTVEPPLPLATARCIHAKYHPGCHSILVLDNIKYQVMEDCYSVRLYRLD